MRSPSGTFELPPEASSQITTLHKEMEEMVRVGGAMGGAMGGVDCESGRGCGQSRWCEWAWLVGL